jgi:hypothetical protein
MSRWKNQPTSNKEEEALQQTSTNKAYELTTPPTPHSSTTLDTLHRGWLERLDDM